MKDIWFRSYKLWVNISKFSRLGNSLKPISFNRERKRTRECSREEHIPDKNLRFKENPRVGQSLRQEGRTYAAVTKFQKFKRDQKDIEIKQVELQR